MLLASSMLKVRVLAVLLMLSLGSSVVLWWITPPVHHSQGDDIPRVQVVKHTGDSILWQKLTSLKNQNDDLKHQLELANQRLLDVNLKLVNLKINHQDPSKNKSSGCSDTSSLSQCEVIHICVVSAGHDATRQTLTLIKSIIFYRHNPLYFHFLTDSVSELILSTLFKTWKLPAAQRGGLVTDMPSHPRSI